MHAFWVKPITGVLQDSKDLVSLRWKTIHLILLFWQWTSLLIQNTISVCHSLGLCLSICWHPLLLMTRLIQSQSASRILWRICLQFSRKSLMSARYNFLICHTSLHVGLFTTFTCIELSRSFPEHYTKWFRSLLMTISMLVITLSYNSKVFFCSSKKMWQS